MVLRRRKVGSPPIERESIGVPGYSVHFFSIDRNPVLTFGRPGGEAFVCEWAKPEFRLGGACLQDAEDEMGPLFAGELPSLEADADDLAKVRTIVIGAEGSGPGRWRDKCKVNANASEDWQEKVRRRGSGWYFIRLYDAWDDLIDSLDFRYIAGLKSIDGVSVDPKQDRVHITFIHDENVSVNMIGVVPAQLERSIVGTLPPSTSFAWPSDPNVRKAAFEVSDGGRPVRVTLNTDRIWWAVVNAPRTTEVAWQSSSLHLTPDDFAPVSSSKLSIRFPRSTTTKAFIGFERENRRGLEIISDGLATLHLYAFSETPIFSFGTHKLRLWIIEDGAESELCLANVKVSTKCPWCETRLSDQEEMLDHVLSQHHAHCFERLTLKGGGVTRAIFVCLVSGCGQYYPESYLPGENPIDRLARHSNALHPDRMAYRKIESPQDISNLLGLREKWVWKCNLGNCRPITPSSDDEAALSDKRAHLIQEHFSDLFICAETEN